MAQLGEFAKAKVLLRRAARSFGPRERVERARCVTAEAEVALASRELRWPTHALDEARRTFGAANYRSFAPTSVAPHKGGRMKSIVIALQRIASSQTPLPPGVGATSLARRSFLRAAGAICLLGLAAMLLPVGQLRAQGDLGAQVDSSAQGHLSAQAKEKAAEGEVGCHVVCVHDPVRRRLAGRAARPAVPVPDGDDRRRCRPDDPHGDQARPVGRHDALPILERVRRPRRHAQSRQRRAAILRRQRAGRHAHARNVR